MTWKEKAKEFGGGDITFLSEDGETIKFIVVGDPVLLVGKYKGTESKKVGCPVITEDGFVLLIAGMRLFRKIAKHEQHFSNTVFMATRHGAEGDPNAEYPLRVLDDEVLATTLFKIKETEFELSMIDEAVQAAQELIEK